ncbi:MAG: glycosyltransferase [Oscillospiraceae bacterium]|nr:glycosyltransferase [Oscillospiraceae bacterium]
MVLSIGMIVKNEEKYLEKCLTALQPILNELDSELIIADTGSTDNTVEIAKKFTDNVFHFEWINDFAAARNSTLERAKGEWFMFIDADEILQDCSDIIHFFKSGEYRKYNSATYIVRSYTDISNMNYFSDIRSQRLVSNDGEIKFQGRIHETFTPFRAPIKFLNLIADHFGYLYSDNGAITELAREKNKRNLEYLFGELDDENITERNFNIYDEIADCYEIIDEDEKALEYVNMGLEKLNHKRIGITTYYSHKIELLIKQEKYQEIIETAQDYFDINKNPSHTSELASDCFIFFSRGYAYYRETKYNDAISDLIAFANLYKKYTQNKLNTVDLMMDNFRSNLSIVKAAFDILFRCCYQEKKFALADDYTKAIPLEKYFDDHDFMINHLNIRIEIMENVGYKKFDELYRQLDDFGKNYLLTAIRRQIFKTSPENHSVLLKQLAQLSGLPSELMPIYREYFEHDSANTELIKTFLEKNGSENSEDMLYILLEKQEDITPFLLTNDFFADRAVQLLMNYFPNGFELFQNYNTSNISSEGMVNATSLYGWVMLRALDNNHEISRIFEMYGDLGLKWYNSHHDNGSLPGDIRAALLVNNVVSDKKAGNHKQFMSDIRELKGVVEDLVPIVDAYKEENKDAFKNNAVNPEFERLAVQVKQNIRDLINARNISEARSLLKEYQGINPNDEDIEKLKDEINNTLQ